MSSDVSSDVPSFVARCDGGVSLRVRVKPRASRSRVLGERGGELEVAVAAPPVDGAANAELVRVLAEHFDVPKSALSIARGTASRSKLVRMVVFPNELRLVLARLGDS